MGKKLKIILLSLGLFILTSCTGSSEDTINVYSQSSNFNIELTESVIDKELSDEDYVTSYDNYEEINLSDHEGDISISKGGVYKLTGVLNGQVKIDTVDKVNLILDNAKIHNETSAAIYIKNSKKVILTLDTGSENFLSGGETYENIDENNIDGVIFSKADLVINGEGTLNIDGKYKHGIVSKDNLIILSGIYNINGESHGLSSKDNIKIYGGTFNIKSNGEGLKSKNEENSERGNIYIFNGEFNIDSVGDAMNATGSVVIDGGNINMKTGDDGIHSDKDIVINNGVINISESYEGLEGMRVTINDGEINILSSDDGINAATSTSSSETSNVINEMPTLNGEDISNGAKPSDMTPPPGPSSPGGFNGNRPMGGNNEAPIDGVYIKINGGTLKVTSGGDSLDSNGQILIENGDITLISSEGTVDDSIDSNGDVFINGGTILALGHGSTQNLSKDLLKQIVIYHRINGESKSFTLLNSNNEVILSREFDEASSEIFISTPELKINETYTLKYDNGSETITLNDVITTNVSRGFMGRGGEMKRE